jgi:hypothetical protein
MVNILYDGSFEGWLTAVFDVYDYKYISVEISTKEKVKPNFFGDKHAVVTNEKKASRVWSGLKNKLSSGALSQDTKPFFPRLWE